MEFIVFVALYEILGAGQKTLKFLKHEFFNGIFYCFYNTLFILIVS